METVFTKDVLAEAFAKINESAPSCGRLYNICPGQSIQDIVTQFLTDEVLEICADRRLDGLPLLSSNDPDSRFYMPNLMSAVPSGFTKPMLFLTDDAVCMVGDETVVCGSNGDASTSWRKHIATYVTEHSDVILTEEVTYYAGHVHLFSIRQRLDEMKCDYCPSMNELEFYIDEKFRGVWSA